MWWLPRRPPPPKRRRRPLPPRQKGINSDLLLLCSPEKNVYHGSCLQLRALYIFEYGPRRTAAHHAAFFYKLTIPLV